MNDMHDTSKLNLLNQRSFAESAKSSIVKYLNVKTEEVRSVNKLHNYNWGQILKLSNATNQMKLMNTVLATIFFPPPRDL